MSGRGAAALVLSGALFVSGSFARASTSAAFLKMDTDARTAGSGGHGTSLGRGAAGLDTNPAAAWWRMNDAAHDVTFDYVAWGAGITDQAAAWTGRFANNRAFGIQGEVVGIEPMDGRSPDGVPQGSFGAQSSSLAVAYAMPLSSRLAAGAAARFLLEKVDVKTGGTVALDAGVQGISKTGRFLYGAAIRNAGLPLSLGGPSSSLPLLIAAGGQIQLMSQPQIWTEVELTAQPLDGRVAGALGADVVKTLGRGWEVRVRAGIRGGQNILTTPAAGLSLLTPWFSLDYAFLYRLNLPAAQRIGVTALIGRVKTDVAARTQPAPKPAGPAPRLSPTPTRTP